MWDDFGQVICCTIFSFDRFFIIITVFKLFIVLLKNSLSGFNSVILYGMGSICRSTPNVCDFVWKFVILALAVVDICSTIYRSSCLFRNSSFSFNILIQNTE